jgi:hypothetical protein
MGNFAQYYIEFLQSFFANIWDFLWTRLKTWGKIFTTDIPSYFSQLGGSVPGFDAGGWIMLIVMTIINLVLIFFVCYRVFQLFRRYIFFRAKEVEKDELLEELAKTKDAVARLTVEKNQLYALKIKASYPGAYSQLDVSSDGSQEVKGEVVEKEELTLKSASRFTKLIEIDTRNEFEMPFYPTEGTDDMTLPQLVDRFINFAASQLHLYYNRDTIRSFLSGMATTKLLILEGISGTGKTSLPYAMGKFFNHSTTIISVQPSWRDRADLLGYMNEFTKTYNETEFLGAVYDASYRLDPSFVILDEMNLARIEYYFAEFLSVMEMPDVSQWLIDIVPTQSPTDPKKLEEGKLLVPQNLWFIGTANQDDSTFTITDKVYDRTIAIELNTKGEFFDAPLTENLSFTSDHLDLMFQKAKSLRGISQAGQDGLKAIDDFLIDNFKVTFGNRIKRQMETFVPVFVACGGTEEDAIDFFLKTKILRKLGVLNLAFLTGELKGLSALIDKRFGKGKFKKCQDYINSLLKQF